MPALKAFECFVLDVDGVMTNGQFFYTADGKVMKAFGPDDNDGLSMLRDLMQIRFITGDRKGFGISEKRISGDMGFELDLVSTVRRVEWIAERYDLNRVVYMGDGIFDHLVMKEVGYSIAPSNADRLAKDHAKYVTERAGGDRAVAEACLHLMETFFDSYDSSRVPNGKIKLSGEWAV